MRIALIAAAAMLTVAIPATANIGTLVFSGTVLTLNGSVVAPVADSVHGSITLSDGSDPDGPPATPDNFTGTVNFTDAFADPGNATFSYGTPLFGGNFLDVNPYHYASVTLANGRLVGFNLYTDGDGDDFTLATGSFVHDYFDEDGNVISADFGTYQLDSPGLSSGTPEPAVWALFVAGFGLVGGQLRRAGRFSVD